MIGERELAGDHTGEKMRVKIGKELLTFTHRMSQKLQYTFMRNIACSRHSKTLLSNEKSVTWLGFSDSVPFPSSVLAC